MYRLLFAVIIFSIAVIQWSAASQVAVAGEQLFSQEEFKTSQLRQQRQERRQQRRQGLQGPQSLTAGGRGAEKPCAEGDTTDDCCEGINFCGCISDPLSGAPSSCFCSPPAGQSC